MEKKVRTTRWQKVSYSYVTEDRCTEDTALLFDNLKVVQAILGDADPPWQAAPDISKIKELLMFSPSLSIMYVFRQHVTAAHIAARFGLATNIIGRWPQSVLNYVFYPGSTDLGQACA